MKHVRRSMMVVAASATALLASAGAAMAQGYAPEPGGAAVTPGARPGAAPSGELPLTGSDLNLLWIALVVLVIGLALFVATRRRGAMRRRGALSEAIS